MSTRLSRNTTCTLNNLEALILAQAVWEHGANAWPAVARLLAKHPLLSRPKSFFTAQTCHNAYNHFMKEAGLECTEANYPTRASPNLKLAEKHYKTRLEELRGLILAEEVKFKAILSEIDDIRSGHWDDKISAEVGIPIRPAQPNDGVTATLSETSPDEVYDGSDLSGMTDTPPSRSQDDLPATKPASPSAEDEEMLHVEGVTSEELSQPVPSLLTGETSETSNILKVSSPMGVEDLDPEEEDHVIPLQVPAAPLSVFEAAVKSPVLVEDVTGLSPGVQTLREQDEVMENSQKEVNQRMEDEVADAQETVRQGQAKKNEEEVVKQEEETAEDHLKEDVEDEKDQGAEENDRVPSLVMSVDSTQSAQIGMYPYSTILDITSNSKMQESTPVVLEVETEPEEVNEDENVSSGEEPLQVIRRSARQRRSSVSSVRPSQTRGRKSRRQKRVSTEPADAPPVDVEAERILGADKEEVMDSPKDEDRDLSPAASDVAVPRRDGKRKASFIEGIGSPRERKRARDDSEPAEEDEPGPSFSISRGRRRTDRTEEQKRFQNVITMLHSQISQHRNGNIFHNPIKPSEAPDYHEIVKRPIDLKTIKMKVKDGAIANSLEFQRDIYLMFANAMIYNRPGSDVHSMAEDMMLESESHILAFRQTEGFVRGAHRI